ncbi:SDR family NAD(P)-dependent oxidoreductase [Rhodovibrionaceae bacterium A322]
MDLGLAGKNIAVTGGSRGIGFAIADICAAEGANISLCSRGQAGLEEARDKLLRHGGQVHIKACDVGNPDALASYIDEAAKALGGLDGLVNNPSGFGYGDNEEGWKKSIDVDLMGVLRATWAALPHLKDSNSGSVLNISSISGIGASGNIAYGAIKASVIHLTLSHAKEHAAAGIRVNCIAPGSIEFPGGVWDDRKKNAPEVYNSTRSGIPFGRMGEPEEIGRTAAFLLSPAASWITGQTLSVDGGQNL